MSKNSQRRKPRIFQAHYLCLEDRRLLAGITFDPGTGLITVDGSDQRDDVFVAMQSPSSLRVELKGVEDRVFSVGDVQLIRFYGMDGDDRFFNDSAVSSEVFGGNGDDILMGGSNVDRIFGGGGGDRIDGRDGDDFLRGENGDDELYGGPGNDYLIGGNGQDRMFGDAGDDTLLGGLGRDELRGGDGHDELYGNEDDDRLWGGTGNDLLVGHSGDDLIFGDQGHDQLFGNEGLDTLLGNEGADVLAGGDGNDVLFGNAGTDRIFGQLGDDWISGGEYSDTINGGLGNDRILGNEGHDRIWGGPGDDRIEGNDGDDQILGEAGLDRAFGGEGNDILWGNDDDDLLVGGNGRDTLIGGPGDDSLFGDEDSDRLFGDAGDDFLSGGDSDDELYGSLGDDVLYGGAGNDQLLSQQGADFVRGDDGNDTVYAGEGNDVVKGGAGNDRLFGQAGDDQLQGDSGNDIVVGNAGVDRLDGGLGDDDIYGDPDDSIVEDEEDTDDSREDRVGRPFGLSNRLTISFAPNGTSIFDQANSLFSSFSGQLSESQIRSSVLDGFNTWAKLGNLDVGLVADSGVPFGTSGKAFDDPRFGDVRIGAISLPGDVNAIAIGQGDFVAGTWAGEILFNSNAVFANVDDFFAVALHEIGHVLGLKHSDNLGSVMHRYSNHLELSAADIAMFQGLYGQRALDSNDDDSVNNDTMATATKIEYADVNGVSGLFPAIAFGDISQPGDIDVYEVRVPDDYSGQVSFSVLSLGISQLEMNVSLRSETGDVLDQGSSNSHHGDRVLLVANATANERFFLTVESKGAGSVGSFSIIAALDSRNTISDHDALAVAQGRHFAQLEQEEISRFFSDPQNYLFNEDGHSDDDELNASELKTSDGFELNSRFEKLGSLQDAQDLDVYRFTTVDDSFEVATLNISIRSLEFMGLAPKLTILDKLGNVVPVELVVNGHGEVAIQLAAFERNREYFIVVEADPLLAFRSGNYELVISHSVTELAFNILAAGSFDSVNKQYHSIHVAQSQMFQFALETEPLANGSQPVVWATIYDNFGNAVYQTATRAGERRTSKAVLLGPGSYTVEIEKGLGAGFNALDYRFLGIEIGDSQGPVFTDPTDSPFVKNDNGEYQYPDNVVSIKNFVVVDGISSNQTDPPDDQPPSNLFLWYWGV